MIENIKEKVRPHVGLGVVVAKEGKVLLGKRKNAHGTGNWGFPGGHLEHGENVEQGALRELNEETGLKGLAVQLGPWTNDIIDEKHYVTLFVFVEFYEGKIQAKEPEKCHGWQWHDWNDLPNPLFPPIRSLIKTVGIDKLKQVSSYSVDSAHLPRNSKLFTKLFS